MTVDQLRGGIALKADDLHGNPASHISSYT